MIIEPAAPDPVKSTRIFVVLSNWSSPPHDHDSDLQSSRLFHFQRHDAGIISDVRRDAGSLQ